MSFWSGKRALIIGGSAGLGRAVADVLTQHGARLSIVARRQATLDSTVQELKTHCADILAISADVTNPDDVRRIGETVRQNFGGLDLLCHCAGRSMRGTILATSPTEFRAFWEVNFLSALQCVQEFADTLTESRGHAVLVGSLASKVAPAYLGAYPSSKFPFAALAQQLRLEMEKNGMHTLIVCPGPIERVESPIGQRCSSPEAGLPEIAHRPGGGAKVHAINPHWLAGRILRACEKRQSELVVPNRSRLLFALSQLSPRLGDWLLRRMTSG